MSQPTDRAAPEQTLDRLISEAFAATGILPTIDACRRMDEQLRAAIEELAEQVRARQAAARPRSRTWYRCDRLLVDTAETLAADMGSGLLSAATHVSALGRHCQRLRECIWETA